VGRAPVDVERERRIFDGAEHARKRPSHPQHV
jgi:hypothetical protein